MSAPGIRERNRVAILDAITVAANQQLLEVGPADLSVRAGPGARYGLQCDLPVCQFSR